MEDKQPVGKKRMEEEETPKQYYFSMLDRIFDSNVEIDYIGEAYYTAGAGRSDPMFRIDCSSYTHIDQLSPVEIEIADFLSESVG